jgi:F5/8 type C domain
MLSRRAWIQSVAALGALSRIPARLFASAASPATPGDADVYVPEWQALSKMKRIQPVVAISDGIPVQGFGAADILATSPDLAVGEVLQERNSAPVSKLQLKKSWEIKSSKIGATPPRTPRTWMMDFKPLRAVHLIDGNPDTYWASRGQTRPDVEPEWIRIDLPRQAMVKAVVITPRRDNQGWPEELTIRVSTDAWHWTTVYEDRSFQPPPQASAKTFSFESRSVKQVWILANRLRWIISDNFIVFAAAGVEVLDEQGDNLALITRGTGVTVSSTNHGAAGEKTTHDMLWPVHYDLGLKWVRVSYWDSVFNWHYAEQEKGKIVIDPLADETMTETVRNGINPVLCLAYGNWLYSKEASQTPKIEPIPPYSTATKQIWPVPFEWPPPPTDSPEHFQAWLRFVGTMVRHFKGRIKYYEIWNEQNGNWNSYYNEKSKTDKAIQDYCRLVKETVRVIRGEYPEAKIMLGSVSGFDREYMTACLKQGVGPLVDVIPWHPFYGTKQDSPTYRNYRSDVKEWKKVCESYGFKGEYMATESGWYAPYPAPAKPFGGGAVSEIVKAKCLASYITMSVGLDLTTFWNTTWHHYTWWDLGLFRNSFSADPISPTQPQAAYYVLRNLCTLLDSAEPASVQVEFSNQAQPFEVDAFRLATGDLLVAVWLPGQPADISQQVVTDVSFPAVSFSRAKGINILNGTEQELTLSGTRLSGIVAKDYPCFLRLENS